jgi:cbb3-type cytochrome oxidase maturation protein
MNILLVLIPVTLLVIAIGVAVFFWAVNHQQFDDLDSPGVLPLMDEPAPTEPPASAAEARAMVAPAADHEA